MTQRSHAPAAIDRSEGAECVPGLHVVAERSASPGTSCVVMQRTTEPVLVGRWGDAEDGDLLVFIDRWPIPWGQPVENLLVNDGVSFERS